MSSDALSAGASTTPLAADLAALLARGGQRFDPVGFHQIEAMLQRAAAKSGVARQRLEQRVAQRIAEIDARLAAAQKETRAAVVRATERFPAAADVLREQFDAGDLSGVRQCLAQLQARRDDGLLRSLLAQFDSKSAPASATVSRSVAGSRASPPNELKAVRHFHRTWSRLRVDQQLLDAIERAPKEAGPLNSHSLILQALRLMRDISPDYLEQFVSHIDALLWLERAGIASNPVSKQPAKRKSGVKRKAGQPLR